MLGYPSHKESPEKWNRFYAGEEKFWCTKVFEHYPFVIAHEYSRLRELLENGQTYGAYFQMKDLFEVLLKFPVLLAASEIYNRSSKDENDRKILAMLMKKALALGDWERVAGAIAAGDTGINANVSGILKSVLEFYRGNGISKWRNDHVGHGALGFDESEEFIECIRGYLIALKEHFEKSDPQYSKVKLFLGSNIELRGTECKKFKARTNVFIGIDGMRRKLYPYITCEEKGIYFFDTYYLYDEKAAILNYPEGDKKEAGGDVSARLKELFNALEKYQLLSKDRAGSSVDDETYLSVEEEILGKLQEIDDFQKPEYLEQWLKTLLEKHKKGVFLLQMERGMGKTTFIRAVDQLRRNVVKLGSETAVRCYYINDTYSGRLDSFTSVIGNEVLAKGSRDEGADLKCLGSLCESSASKKTDFAALLNKSRRAREEHFDKKKLLMVLDGVDEIPATAGETIFDFVPDLSRLDDGVYLLLTCRTPEEIEDHTKARLKGLEISEAVSFERDQECNIKTLKAYVMENILKLRAYSPTVGTQENFIAQVLRKAEYRFLYARTVKELLEASGSMSVDLLPEGEKLFEFYMAKLYEQYGPTYFNSIKRILAIIATAYEPLTLREIAYLSGERGRSFRILMYLTDLRGFLKAERSDREGSVVSIYHEDWKNSIRRLYAGEIREMAERWFAQCSEYDFSHLKEEGNEGKKVPVTLKSVLFDGHTYLLTHILKYTASYLGKVSLNSKLPRVMYETAYELIMDPERVYQTSRAIGLYTEAIQLKALLDGTELAFMYTSRSNAYERLGKLQDALEDYNSGIGILEELAAKKQLWDEGFLAMVYSERGVLHSRIGNKSEGIADCGRAVKMGESLKRSGRTEMEDILPSLYMHRGIALDNSGQSDKAVPDYTRSIDLLEELERDGKPYSRSMMATILTDRGAAYLSNNSCLDKAVADYSAALDIMEKLKKEGILESEDRLAWAYGERGAAHLKSDNGEDAIADCTIAIDLREKLRAEGIMLDEEGQAKAYMNRGSALRLLSRKGAVENYLKALDIVEQLEKTDDIKDKGLPGAVYIYLAEVYVEEGKLPEAEDAYNRYGMKARLLLDIYPPLISEYMRMVYGFMKNLDRLTEKFAGILCREAEDVLLCYRDMEEAKEWTEGIDGILKLP